MKILHCADVHIGYETHGRLDPATGLNTRLLDFRRSLDAVVARAVDERVDLFLFAGDAYRTADPTPTQQKLFAEALRPLAEAEIPLAMVVGNHDHPVSFGKASSLDIFGVLDGRVDVFTAPAFRAEGHAGGPIETRGGPLQLVALPWPIRSKILARDEHRGKTPHEVRQLIEDHYTAFVARCAAEADPGTPLVVCAHLTVQGSELSGSERASLIAHEPTFTVAQLAPPGVDYVALGHIHRFQDRNREAFERGDGPPVVYSSSIERISFKEHDADKGFVVVEIDPAGAPGRRTAYTFVPTPARRFVPVAVDATEAEDPTAAVLAEIARSARSSRPSTRAPSARRSQPPPRSRPSSATSATWRAASGRSCGRTRRSRTPSSGTSTSTRRWPSSRTTSSRRRSTSSASSTRWPRRRGARPTRARPPRARGPPRGLAAPR